MSGASERLIDKVGFLHILGAGTAIGAAAGAISDDSTTVRGSLSGALTGLGLGISKKAGVDLWDFRKEVKGYNPKGKFFDNLRGMAENNIDRDIKIGAIGNVNEQKRKDLIANEYGVIKKQMYLIGGLTLAGFTEAGFAINSFTTPVNRKGRR